MDDATRALIRSYVDEETAARAVTEAEEFVAEIAHYIDAIGQ